MSTPAINPMKPHELETLMLMSDGKTAEEIGIITGRSRNTIVARIEMMKAKANVCKDTALVAKAIRSGWIQ